MDDTLKQKSINFKYTQTMKQSYLTFCILALFASFVYGQENKLILSKYESKSSEKSSGILQKSEAFTSVDFVNINLGKIPAYEEFTLDFLGKNISVNKERIDARDVNNFCFVGKDNEGSQIVMSVLDNDIQGVIETSDGIFSIVTLGENDYAVIKIDQSKFREGCCDMQQETEYSSTKMREQNLDVENNITTSSPISEASATYECKIRVLVLFTPGAQSAVSNIKNNILSAIDLTNQTFINSNINYRVELAYAGLTDYKETGTTSTDYSISLSRFLAKGDGHMDEVHTLRDRYSADICVLLTSNPAYCGLGYVLASENYAFCEVTAGECATVNYSFGHEMGHLLGCLHDNYVDPANKPFPYGHGYIYIGENSETSWRTIMSYNNHCSDCGVSCVRRSYWANPYVSYNGIPTGTVSTNNTARVWNERSTDVMAFRQPENNLTFTNSDIHNGQQYADLIARENITTSGTVNIPNGVTVKMRAGNGIFLQPGFSVGLGSQFSATTENIHDCGTNPFTLSKIIIQNVPEEPGNETDVSVNKIPPFSYTVYPNPSEDFIDIQYSLNSDIPLSIELVNFLGQKVKTVLTRQNQQAGNYTLQIPISDLPAGTYFLIISSSNQTKTEKIIINK